MAEIANAAAWRYERGQQFREVKCLLFVITTERKLRGVWWGPVGAKE